jgi:hypothetical protein
VYAPLAKVRAPWLTARYWFFNNLIRRVDPCSSAQPI